MLLVAESYGAVEGRVGSLDRGVDVGFNGFESLGIEENQRTSERIVGFERFVRVASLKQALEMLRSLLVTHLGKRSKSRWD